MLIGIATDGHVSIRVMRRTTAAFPVTVRCAVGSDANSDRFRLPCNFWIGARWCWNSLQTNLVGFGSDPRRMRQHLNTYQQSNKMKVREILLFEKESWLTVLEN